MTFLRTAVRSICTLSVGALSLLLLGVWTRFDDFNLYQNLGDLARTPQQHFYGFNLLSADRDSGGGDSSDPSPETTVHRIVLSVCCLQDYGNVQVYAQEFIDLFHTIFIESLGTATRMTPRKEDGPHSTIVHQGNSRTAGTSTTHISLSGNSKGTRVRLSLSGNTSEEINGRDRREDFDSLATVFSTKDIALSFVTPDGADEDAKMSPLNMVIELLHHDDLFTMNLIHQVWLSAHKLEVAMATTIDSHLKRHGVISVKWILPHFEAPAVPADAKHVDFMINQLDRLKEVEMKNQFQQLQGDLESDEVEYADGMHKQKVLRKDLHSIDKLIMEGRKALPPLHDMQGFLDHYQARLQQKVKLLQGEMSMVEAKLTSMQTSITITRQSIESETHSEMAEEKMVASLEQQEDSLWNERAGMLQELLQFEKEWERMVRMVSLYESYLLQKYHVVTERQFNLSTRFFVKEEGEDTDDDSWECDHEEDTDFCGERVIKCAFHDDLPRDQQMRVEMSTKFPEHLELLNISTFKLALYVDYGNSDMCDSLLYSALNVKDSSLQQECNHDEEASGWSCSPEAVVDLSTTEDEAIINAMCFFIECDSNKPFAMHSVIDVKHAPSVEEEGSMEEEEEEEEEEEGEEAEEPGESGSLLAVMHRYTFAVTVLVTMGAIMMSVFFMPSQ